MFIPPSLHRRPTVYLVTEPVRPLAEVLTDLGLTGQQRTDFITFGLDQAKKKNTAASGPLPLR